MPVTGDDTVQRKSYGHKSAVRETVHEADIDLGLSRRNFLRFAGLGALIAASGCGRVPEEAVPRVTGSPGTAPGEPLHYAGGWPFDGIVQPVMATVRDGRPVKIDGNPNHPASSGAADTFTQATILSLYDPERLQAMRHEANVAGPDAFDAELSAARARWAGGAGLRIVTPPTGSPTFIRQMQALQAAYPNVGWHEFSPVASPLALARRARLDRAEVIVSFGDDLLGPGPLQVFHATGWAQKRREMREQGRTNCMFVAEAAPTLTGARADGRLPAREGRLGALFDGLDAALAGEEPRGDFTPAEVNWIARAAAAIAGGGPGVLVTAGAQTPPALQARAHALTQRLGGRTLEPVTPPAMTPRPFAALVDEAKAGAVDTILMLDVNPVYAASADEDIAEALSRTSLTIAASLFDDETAAAAQWSLPLAHPYETWSDGIAADGSAVIMQPFVEAPYETFGVHRLIALLTLFHPMHADRFVAGTGTRSSSVCSPTRCWTTPR